MIRTQPKDKSLSALIHELDDVFSKYIRRRDANPVYQGCLNCFVCGAAVLIKEAHCIHYINRAQMSVRYDEINAHGGCEDCNCYDPKHDEKYHAAMVHKYGETQVKLLHQKARALQKFMRHELIELIETYKSKLKQLQ